MTIWRDVSFKNEEKVVFSTGAIFVILSLFIIFYLGEVEASRKSSHFCAKLFGVKASIIFDPLSSNRGVIITDNILRNTDVKRRADIPKPTGFFCEIKLKENSKRVCPKFMKLMDRENKCISEIYSLNELCPQELEEIWPELKNDICNEK